MGEVARPAPSAAAPVSEDFDAIFEEVSERLQGQMRPPEAPPDVADEASVLLAQLNAEEEQAVVEPEIQAGARVTHRWHCFTRTAARTLLE